MSNLGSFNPGGMGLKIADLYLEDLLQTEKSELEPDKEIQAIEIGPQIIESYTGLYELEPGVSLTLIRGGYQLMIRIPGEGWQTLLTLSETRFSSQDGSAEIEFSKDSQGMVSSMIIFKDGSDSLRAGC
jgi:hypothetical protein